MAWQNGGVNTALDSITQHRLVPIATVDHVDDALWLAGALRDAALPLLEITLRTDAALPAIERIAQTGMLIGAGTVLEVDQARRAIDAGASFLVSPSLDDDVVAYAQERGVLMLAGVATATEIHRAMRMGLRVMKLFPTVALGGAALVKALAGPFPDVRFVTTGSIALDHLPSLLVLPAVLACGGDFLAPRDLIAARRTDLLHERIAEAMRRRDRAGFCHNRQSHDPRQPSPETTP